jgi:fibronectin type 3 domain-containing protein
MGQVRPHSSVSRGEIVIQRIRSPLTLVFGVLAVACVARFVSPIAAQTFVDSSYASELVTTLPEYKAIGVTWAANGDMYIAQRDGVVRVYAAGQLLSTPFIDLSSSVNTFLDRGLLGMALHPDFAQNGYVYLAYGGPKLSRLVRVTADPSDHHVALPGSEVVLIGSLPVTAGAHTASALRFAPDGRLLFDHGDGWGEIGYGRAARNFGWRCYEGPEPRKFELDVADPCVLLPRTADDAVDELLETGPDGLRYYVSFVTGQVRRLRFDAPVARPTVAPASGYSPLRVTFTGDGSFNPRGGTLTYLWEFGDGQTSTLANPLHTYATSSVPANYSPRLTVTDARGRSSSVTVPVTVGSLPPTPTIEAPTDGTAVELGQLLTYRGSATDPDELLDASALSWTMLLHRDDHIDTLLESRGSTGNFVAQDEGDAGTSSYELRLTATDSSGLASTAAIHLPLLAHADGHVAASTEVLGLVAAYGFAEGAGTIVADASGNANTGSITGASWNTTGKYGSSLTFNGTSHVVLIPNSASLNLSSGMTLEAWVYPTTSQTGWRAIIQRETDAYVLHSSSSFGAMRPTAGGTFSGAFDHLNVPSAIPVNAWSHLALTWDGSTIRLHVNGVEGASKARTGTLQGTAAGAGAVRIGNNVPYAENFLGRIDEVRIYNRALSTTEIATDMNTPIGSDATAPTPPASLVATATSASQVSLTWTASTDTGGSGLAGYRVERCAGATCTGFVEIAAPTTNAFADTGLSASTAYRYRVRAIDGASNSSGYSNIAAVTTQASSGTTPTPPTSLVATASGESQIDLSWTASTTSSGSSGLEWPGTGSVRRMLYWANPQSNGLPIYPATYIFRVYPREKQYPGSCYGSGSCNNKYWTTFFWGNNGRFDWDGGVARTYYGAHPYPVPPPTGTQEWEISVQSNDTVTGIEVAWDRWHVQAFRAHRLGNGQPVHEFYYDLSTPVTLPLSGQPDLDYQVFDAAYGTQQPPSPALVMGQAPRLDGPNGTSIQSWGGYPGWEEFSGIIRGIQIYSTYLSDADIAAEIGSPMSTAAGRASIWYLNLDPRPSDVTDKKGMGTAHNPSWDGTTANEWTGSGGSLGYRIERCQGAACTSFVEIGSSATPSFTDTGRLASTTYRYRVRAVDGAGNASGYSGVAEATTQTQPDITPPTAPSALAATASSASQIGLTWTASTDSSGTGLAGYRVERCPGATCTGFVEIAAPVTNTFTDTGRTASTTYRYRVRAFDVAGNASGYSNLAGATTLATPATMPPTDPGSLVATASSASQVSLTWTASTDTGGSGLAGYRVERCQGATCTGFVEIAAPVTNAFTDTGRIASTTYGYRVRAFDVAGSASGYSNIAQATTLAATGLVAAYSFNEPTGSSASDASGQGNTGTISGATRNTSGKFGGSLTFNGSTHEVLIPSSTSLDLSTRVTIEVWVYPTVSQSGWRAIVQRETDAYVLHAGSNVGTLRPTGGGTFDGALATLRDQSSLPVGAWTHVALTWDGATMRLYTNGVLRTSKSRTGTLQRTADGAGPVRIGNNVPYRENFLGRIDEVRIYDRALSAAEILTDMSAPLP